jgi:hypothetical protein
MKRLTDKEVHDGLLVEIFDHLKSAQAALDSGDLEALGDALCEAGFSVCCLLPDRYAESAPGAWFEEGMA